MKNSTFAGMSEAARLLERTHDSIIQRQRCSVTLSRQQALEEVFRSYQEADDEWKIGESDTPISEEVMETACRLIEALPLGMPSPKVAGEPDGHISLEWYRNPRRLVTVSIGPDGCLHWAALIGLEDPRGTGRFVDRIPKTILSCIQRVFTA